MSRVMALDVGTRTIGVAVSDPLGMIASPVETISRTGRRADAARVQELAAEREVVRVVVGLPMRTDGTEGESAVEARRMAAAVAAVLPGVEVVLLDERFTTAEAERSLLTSNVRRKKRKQVIDQVAAVLILQQWLDRPFGGEVVEAAP